MPAPTCAICAKLVQFRFLQRSILNPLSLLELSVHVRLMRVLDAAAALKPLGAAGNGGGAADVVALAVFENDELDRDAGADADEGGDGALSSRSSEDSRD